MLFRKRTVICKIWIIWLVIGLFGAAVQVMERKLMQVSSFDDGRAF
jgi:hypothetical protein